jgi:hypothetical protein
VKQHALLTDVDYAVEASMKITAAVLELLGKVSR